MFKALPDVVRAARNLVFPDYLSINTLLRALSTNTAIHRGIRKSRFEAGHGKPVYQRQEGSTRRPREDRRDDNGNTRKLRDWRHQDEPVFKNADYQRNSSSQLTVKERNQSTGRTDELRKRDVDLDVLKNVRERRWNRQGTNRDNAKDYSTQRGYVEPNSNSKWSETLQGVRRRTPTVLPNPPKALAQTNSQGWYMNGKSGSGSGHKLPYQSQKVTNTSAKHYQSPHMESSQDQLPADTPTKLDYPHAASDSRFSDIQSRQRLKTPISIPHTTAASEFLYGTSVVIAALRIARRKLYKLYIYTGLNRDSANQDKRIERLARLRNLEVEKVDNNGLRLMDKMSLGRPHNGYILEASALPKLPVAAFQRVLGPKAAFSVVLDHQSREDASINGTDLVIKYTIGFPRYPVVLMLDRILDPGNLGAILRSAFFLGVDAVAISNHNSASLTPVALKASAGASEIVPLITLSHPRAFLEETLSNGWKFYGAVAKMTHVNEGQTALSLTDLDTPARDHPCIIGLGGEGEGLNETLQRKADFLLSIEGHEKRLKHVDSLNVSVAAGLLCEAFLRKPTGKLNVPPLHIHSSPASMEREAGEEAVAQESEEAEKVLF